MFSEEEARIRGQQQILQQYLKGQQHNIPHERYLYVKDIKILLDEIDRLRKSEFPDVLKDLFHGH